MPRNSTNPQEKPVALNLNFFPLNVFPMDPLNFDINSLLPAAIAYVQNEVIPKIMGGDLLYIALTGILLIFIVILIVGMFQVTKWIFSLVKKFFLLILIIVSGYFFVMNFYDKLSVEAIQQASLSTILIGGVGGVLLLIALAISLFSFIKHFREKKAKEPLAQKAPVLEATTVQMPKMLSTQALKAPFQTPLLQQLKTDRSLLAVLSYVIIAEFGIFSSKTFPAPSTEVGMMFFGVFAVGAFIFIKTSYHSYKRGLFHLTIAGVFAFILSVFLGHFWGEVALGTLLSIDYFSTTALVAVITAIAVSLLMGSRG